MFVAIVAAVGRGEVSVITLVAVGRAAVLSRLFNPSMNFLLFKSACIVEIVFFSCFVFLIYYFPDHSVAAHVFRFVLIN